MKKQLTQAFKQQIAFYRSIKLIDYISLAVLHIFIAWNGIQFFIVPTHVNYLIGYNSLMRSISIITYTQMRTVPLLLFIIMSIVIIFFFIRNYMEIVYLEMMKSEKQRLKHKFNLWVNYTIPSFFHNIGVVFIMSSLYLMLLIAYFLLVVLGIHIPVDVFFVKRWSLIYFFTGLVIYNTVTIDFVLPEMSKTGSYTNALTEFLNYFMVNKQNIFYFYSFKFFLIALNMLIFVCLIRLFVQQPLFRLPLSVSLQTSVINVFTFLSSLWISMIRNSVLMQFLNVYSFKFFKQLFDDYAEYEYEGNDKLVGT